MNLWRLNNHLTDSLRCSGEVCLINLDHAAALSNMEKISGASNRMVHMELNNMTEYCFIFLNSNNVTVDLLEDAWKLISYGGTIFFSTYSNSGMASNRAIRKFLTDKESEITSARQMLLNGKRETNLIIKCFPLKKKKDHLLNNEFTTIVTVLKTGGDYDVNYVNHIANSVKEHVTVPYKFTCITDAIDGFCPNVNKIIPFDHDFPKWWGKIELFKPYKFESSRIFFLDLDTLIINNIDEIVKYGGDFFGLRDFYQQYGIATGLMCWRNDNPKIYQIYEKFMENPIANMNNCKMGDQEFVNNIIGKTGDYAQDLYPKQIVSYKKDCVKAGGEIEIPGDARILCFHGPPRPHQIKDPVIARFWRG